MTNHTKVFNAQTIQEGIDYAISISENKSYQSVQELFSRLENVISEFEELEKSTAAPSAIKVYA